MTNWIARALPWIVFCAVVWGMLGGARAAEAKPYQVRWTQEDCQEVAMWELWGARGGSAPAKLATWDRGDMPAIQCPPDALTPIVDTFDGLLRRGLWTFTLRAIAADGESAESNPVTLRVPLPQPVLLDVAR